MKYNFNIQKVEIIDLNEVDYREEFLKQTQQPFNKMIGNHIYAQTNDIDLADKARDIHQSKPIILTEREKPIFEKIIEESNYMPMIKRAILSEIKKIEEQCPNGHQSQSSHL